jgi:hypothetical protein
MAASDASAENLTEAAGRRSRRAPKRSSERPIRLDRKPKLAQEGRRAGAGRRPRKREVRLIEVPGKPGWGGPPHRDTTSFANIPLCPDFGTADIVGQRYLLMVTVTDGDRTATRSAMVTPRGADSDDTLRAKCECWCRANYALGSCADAS